MKKYPYKIKGDDNHIFIFSHIENNLPVYRTDRGSKHIFDIEKYEVLEETLEIEKDRK